MNNEDELLAQAIALSLEGAAQTTSAEPETAYDQSTQSLTPSERPHTVSHDDAALIQTHSASPSAQSPDAIVSSLGQQSQLAQAVLGGQATLPATRLSSIHASQWQPNLECLELVLGMGISENAAKRALYYTGNDNAELAVAWVFENIEDPELHEPFEPPPVSPVAVTQPSLTGPVCHSFDELLGGLEEDETATKMVFVVNTTLKMGVGKIAAQVGHATLGLYRLLQALPEQQASVKQWEELGSKKVVLKGEGGVQQLLDLKRKAYELHIPNIMVHDAGRTQVEPGALTVFAIYGRKQLVDQVTGKLKLL